jgi:hypothetical protein
MQVDTVTNIGNQSAARMVQPQPLSTEYRPTVLSAGMESAVTLAAIVDDLCRFEPIL